MLLTLARLSSKAVGSAPLRKAAVKAVDKDSVAYKVKKWLYYKQDFPQLGLRKDDVTFESAAMEPIITEALRRIPKEELDARNFRLFRAIHLSMNKQILPKEEWTDFEADESYLQPYIEEVQFEMEEKFLWDSK